LGFSICISRSVFYLNCGLDSNFLIFLVNQLECWLWEKMD
jgi:hypothetical protein